MLNQMSLYCRISIAVWISKLLSNIKYDFVFSRFLSFPVFLQSLHENPESAHTGSKLTRRLYPSLPNTDRWGITLDDTAAHILGSTELVSQYQLYMIKWLNVDSCRWSLCRYDVCVLEPYTREKHQGAAEFLPELLLDESQVILLHQTQHWKIRLLSSSVSRTRKWPCS